MEQGKQKEVQQQQTPEQKQPVAKRKKRQLIAASTVTFTELRKILQEMRPYTLQVLKTPYYRNCKAARNMRRDMRQMRELCKQVRIETVLLGKRNKPEGSNNKRQRRPPKPPAPVGNTDVPDAEVSRTSDVLCSDSQNGPSFVTTPVAPGSKSSRLGSTVVLQQLTAEESS